MGCEGLLKHLANIKVLRHQIVNVCLIPAGELEAVLSKLKLMIQPEHLQDQPAIPVHRAKVPPTPHGAEPCTTPDPVPPWTISSLLFPLSQCCQTVCFPPWVQKDFKKLQSLKTGLRKRLEGLKERIGSVILAH